MSCSSLCLARIAHWIPTAKADNAGLACLIGVLAISFATQASADVAEAYRVVEDWPQLPSGLELGEVTGVAVDSHNHVFIFHRGDENPVLCVEAGSGTLVHAFGDGMFKSAHGLAVDQEDNVWVTDTQRHQVFKFSHDGALLMTVGEEGVAGDDETHFDQPWRGCAHYDQWRTALRRQLGDGRNDPLGERGRDLQSSRHRRYGRTHHPG